MSIVLGFSMVKREGLHEGYAAQLQYYIHRTGWNWGSFAVMNLDKWELLPFDMGRDQKLIGALLVEGEKFWRSVTGGPEPEALPSEDSRCGRCQYRTKCHGELPEPVFDGKMHFDASLAPLIAEYQQASAIYHDAESYRDEVKDLIAAAVGERAAVDTGAGVIKWVPSGSFIPIEALRKKSPELAVELAVQKKPSLRIYPKKGK